MSEPDSETYPDGPGWVTPGYPRLPPPRRPDLPAYGTGSGGQVVRYAGREPPTNPHWVPPRPGPPPEPDPMHVDRRRGLRLAAILIIAVVVLGVTAMVLFRMTGHH